MNVSLTQAIIFLLLGIGVIVLLTIKFHAHAFFALMIACFITGIGVRLSLPGIITAITGGFGHTMQALGFIIVLGTTLGALLEHTGSTQVMANYILKKVGEKNASLAISITGFIVGLPVFCDSGYIVLNGLNKSLAKRSGISIAVMSVSLASGLYAVHCLVPPHPGATAAAASLAVDFGKLLCYGSIIAIPAMLVGHWWSRYAGKKIKHPETIEEENNFDDETASQPSVLKSFLPVIVPIVLIASKSFVQSQFEVKSVWLNNLFALGDPVLALSIGVLLALNAKQNWDKKTLSRLLHNAIDKAGNILIITGAGGAFGAVIATVNIGSALSGSAILGSAGIVFPFLITFILKTAQGSSTVAIITATSIVLPLLAPLGMDSGNGRLLCVLAMGAGSMMISHANDAYFWVIAKFSGLSMKAMLKVYTPATIIMGIVTFAFVFILSLILQV